MAKELAKDPGNLVVEVKEPAPSLVPVGTPLLCLREDQLQLFRSIALRRFADEMVDHLGAFSPPHLATLGKGGMRTVVQQGIDRAAGHGFTLRGPVRLYLESMLSFGSDFDADPQYPWAGEILAAAEPADQMERAEILYEKILDYRERVVGPDDAYLRAALRKINLFIAQASPLFSGNTVPGLLEEISNLYPQKTADLGRSGLEELIGLGIEQAQRHCLASNRGYLLVTMLMLVLGCGFASDPLYPWVVDVLEDRTIGDAEARVRVLHENAGTWFKRVQAEFDEKRS